MPCYLKAPDQILPSDFLAANWGRFTRYLEIGEDLFATRQVDVFENGYALRYDRQHYVDDYGMLADMKFGERWAKHWPGQALDLTPQKFQEIWEQSQRTKAAPLQAEFDPSTWPDEPPWITITRKRGRVAGAHDGD